MWLSASKAASVTRQLLALGRKQVLQAKEFDLNVALVGLYRRAITSCRGSNVPAAHTGAFHQSRTRAKNQSDNRDDDDHQQARSRERVDS